MSTRGFFIVALVGLLGACQIPLGLSKGFKESVRLVFETSHPSVLPDPSHRLLLSTVNTITVKITEDTKTVFEKTTVLSGTSAEIEVDLDPVLEHSITAEAKALDGTLLFRANTSVTLYEDQELTLYLLPVQADGSTWPTLAATAQPGSGSFPTQPKLTAGAYRSFLIDFGTTATKFQFDTIDPSIDVYLQRLDGSPFDFPDATQSLTPDDLTAPDTGQTFEAFWVTFHQKGSGLFGSVGRFTIPLTSIDVPASLDLGLGDTLDLASQVTLVPANTTNSGVVWSIDDASVATVTSAGLLTVLNPPTPASATVTVTSSTDASVTSDIVLTIHGSEYSNLADLSLTIDGVDAGWSGVPLANRTESFTSASANPIAVLTATAGSAGQTLEWSKDGGTTWNFANQASSTTWDFNWALDAGTNNLWLRVTAPGGAGQNTYKMSLVRIVSVDLTVTIPTYATLDLSLASLTVTKGNDVTVILNLTGLPLPGTGWVWTVGGTALGPGVNSPPTSIDTSGLAPGFYDLALEGTGSDGVFYSSDSLVLEVKP